MADLNQAYAACPELPSWSIFASDLDVYARCSCVASVQAQHLGQSMEELRLNREECVASKVSERRMWRWIGAGAVVGGAWLLLRRNKKD